MGCFVGPSLKNPLRLITPLFESSKHKVGTVKNFGHPRNTPNLRLALFL